MDDVLQNEMQREQKAGCRFEQLASFIGAEFHEMAKLLLSRQFPASALGIPLVGFPNATFPGSDMPFQLTISDERRWLLVLLQLERMRIAALTQAAK